MKRKTRIAALVLSMLLLFSIGLIYAASGQPTGKDGLQAAVTATSSTIPVGSSEADRNKMVFHKRRGERIAISVFQNRASGIPSLSKQSLSYQNILMYKSCRIPKR